MANIKVISLNVNGLNIDAKRRIIFDHLRKLKADLYLLQETHASDNSVRLWSQEWGGKILANNGTQSSKGVMILFDRSLSFKILNQWHDEEGRILGLDLELAGVVYSLINIYAPTQDRPKEQVAVLNRLEQFLTEMDASNIIIGGDFNCLLNPAIDKNNKTPCNPSTSNVRNKIFMLMEEWGLMDIWRVRNPAKRDYTFRRGAYASRLDLFLIAQHLSDVVTNTSNQYIVHSDHAMIILSLRPTVTTRGPGYWKFDTTLLANKDFIEDMSLFLSEWLPPEEISNPNTIWDWFKCEIRTHIRQYTKNLHSEERQHIADITKELDQLYAEADTQGVDRSTEMESLRRELRELEEARARKLIFRSRANWSLYGERPSKYFLNLEKRRNSERGLHTIFNAAGDQITDIKEILEEGRGFYEQLYRGSDQTLLPIDQLQDEMSNLDRPSVPREYHDSLEAPFSQNEFREALSKLNSVKQTSEESRCGPTDQSRGVSTPSRGELGRLLE